ERGAGVGVVGLIDQAGEGLGLSSVATGRAMQARELDEERALVGAQSDCLLERADRRLGVAEPLLLHARDRREDREPRFGILGELVLAPQRRHELGPALLSDAQPLA